VRTRKFPEGSKVFEYKKKEKNKEKKMRKLGELEPWSQCRCSSKA